MACCFKPGDPEARKQSKRIENQLKGDQKKLEMEVKLLLLGAGESGKSTIAKQMKIIHMSGYTQQERLTFKPTIHNNVINAMRTLVEEASKRKLQLEASNKDAGERLLLTESVRTLGKELVKDIKDLWSDPSIQITYEKRNEFYLQDNVSFYFDEMDRIGAEGYIPDLQDILKARATTTGIYETDFHVQNAHFRMIDVGGQRTERKKWIHCFEGVTAVLFCVGMSEYDQKLLEDDETNRMHESLRLFREVCNSHWFMQTSMILFLNKTDLFSTKLLKTPITVCFPDYKGENDFESTKEYIKQQFVSQNNSPDKSIYTHFTCATDTNNITIVFNAVRDIILRQQLNMNGMM